MDTDWNGHYELLRQTWLRGETTGATILVVRQGLLAWMRSGPGEVCPPASPAVAPQADALPGTPALYADEQLLGAFVTMILHRQQEQQQ